MEYFYIYNLQQAMFFVKYGLVPIEIAKGNKDDVYVKFVRDTNSKKVFNMWANNKK